MKFQSPILSTCSAVLAGFLFSLSANAATLEQIDACRRDAAPLIAAIEQVETGGIPDAKRGAAKGDNGAALGWAQMHRGAYLDAVESCKGVKWPAYEAAAADRVWTARVMAAYWLRYKRTTPEARARLWNSGPTGDKRPKARANAGKYWAKVQANLKK